MLSFILAATLSAAVSSANNTLVLTADRLLDVETGKLLSPGVVVVKDKQIVAVNPDQLPESAEIVALGDATLLPGLIDMHTHITQEMMDDWGHAPVTQAPTDAALRGARNAQKTLHAGFTTIRDLGAGGFADVAVMRAINSGIIEGPDIFPSAHAVGITGGHCDVTGLVPEVAEKGPEQGVADGKEAILRAIRYQIKHGAKVIKTCATAGVMSRGASVGNQQYSDEELHTIVAEASRQGVKVAAHAHGINGILAAVEAGVDSIEHGTIMTRKIARAMKKNGTFLVPTVYLIETFDLTSVPDDIRKKAAVIGREAYAGLELAIREQVPIAYGTDTGVIPHGDNGKQFAVLVNHGMSPINAIRSATLNAAKLLGVEDRGRLAPGLRADIIAVTGNPLKDIQAMESAQFVMKEGRIYLPLR
ncbi:amidohydrolase family protein [Pseudomaricurvus alkylphenolicus]|uniref:metal-dependent hydrolase family protein n=1 Tax=Pseudomaricurvus alkylphenolicus TaxID=1306991 RepID=UPI00141FE21D|nr:amidohydrolase family protein [Pseudomaricurvus alkylphenolicus]NIB38421.1 amidohydrolase family protein [Pseudomaricurvus alkylphenolicus]